MRCRGVLAPVTRAFELSVGGASPTGVSDSAPGATVLFVATGRAAKKVSFGRGASFESGPGGIEDK